MLEKKNNNSNSVELEIEVKECEQSNIFNFSFYFLFFKNYTLYINIIDNKFFLDKFHLNNNDLIFIKYPLNKNLEIIDLIIKKSIRKNYISYSNSFNFLINIEKFCHQIYISYNNVPEINEKFYIKELLSFQIKHYYLSEISSNYITNSSLKDSNFLYYSNILKKLNLLNFEEGLYSNNILYFISFSCFNFNKDCSIKNFIIFYKNFSLFSIIYILYTENFSYEIKEDENTKILYYFLKELNIKILSKKYEINNSENFSSYNSENITQYFNINSDINKKFYIIENYLYTDFLDNYFSENDCVYSSFNTFYEYICIIINKYNLNKYLETNIFKHFINFEKKLKFNLLEFYLNFEGSLLQENNNSEKLNEFSNFVQYKQLNPYSKNNYDEYFNTYSIDNEFKKKFLDKFKPLDLSFASLIWFKHFNLINFYINDRKPIKTNKNNIHKSSFRVNILNKIYDNLNISYFYPIIYEFNNEVKILEIFNYLDNNFIFIYNFFNLSEEISFDWSKIMYNDYINNFSFKKIYKYMFGLYIFLQKNICLFFSCATLYKKKNKKIIIKNEFLILFDDIEKFLNTFILNKKNTELLINNLIGLMNIYEKCFLLINKYVTELVNLPKLFTEYNSNFKNIKNNYKYKDIKEFSENYKILSKYLKKIKPISKKNISSFLNFLFLNKNFEKLTKIDLEFKFSFFFDFRGRIYTYDSNYSWISNSQLRPFIKITQKFDKNIDLINFKYTPTVIDILKSFLKEYFNINLDFLNKKKSKLILDFVYIFSIYIAVNLVKNKYEIEYIKYFFELYKKKDYINLSLKNYNKIFVFEYNLNKIKQSIDNNENFNFIYNITLSLDSVSNGFTHILGLFKDLDENKFINYLKISNYYDLEKKYDIYDNLKENIHNFIDKKSNENIDKFLIDFKNKISIYLKKYLFLENEDVDKNLQIITESIFNLKTILITRKLLKKPLMTILYSSKFKTWREDIDDTIFDEIFLLNSENIIENENYLKLQTLFTNKNKKEIIKFLGYAITTIFSLKKDLIPMYDKLIYFSNNLKNKLNSLDFKNIKDIRFEIDNNTSFSLIYFKEENKKEFKISFFNNKERISYKEVNYEVLTEFNVNKIVNAAIPNIIHSCDGYICLEILKNLLEKNIVCASIHDCFIFPWYSIDIVKLVYNETFFNFYKNNYIYNNIYIINKDNEKIKLFNINSKTIDEEIIITNEFWIKNKETIINAKFNLSFE